MIKPRLIWVVLVFTMGVFMNSWAANPCKTLARACMQQGYYKGGNKTGKGLVEDCMLPVIGGNKTLPNANFSSAQLQQCKTMLMQKMKKS